MAHTAVVLIRRVARTHMVETVPASELFDFLLAHAVTAHSFLTRVAKIHFVTDPGA